MYYKSPEIAPLAQPANPLEATRSGGTHRRGTRMPMEDLASAVARGAAGAAAIGAARAGTASAAPAGAGAATDPCGLDDFFRGIRGGIWRDTGRYREIPGDTRRYEIRADTGR